MERGGTRALPGEGRKMWVLGELVTYKVTSERTGGAYSLFEVTTPPGAGPPPHIQHREDEAFYVLEGRYEFLDEDHLSDLGAGSLVYVPKGSLHAHKNVGEGVGRMLVIQTPGGEHERLFEELGVPATDRSEPPAPEERPYGTRVFESAAKHGVEIPSIGR